MTDHPISTEKVSIRQIFAGMVHILHFREEVQVVLVEVKDEELSRHVWALNNQLNNETWTEDF